MYLPTPTLLCVFATLGAALPFNNQYDGTQITLGGLHPKTGHIAISATLYPDIKKNMSVKIEKLFKLLSTNKQPQIVVDSKNTGTNEERAGDTNDKYVSTEKDTWKSYKRTKYVISEEEGMVEYYQNPDEVPLIWRDDGDSNRNR